METTANPVQIKGQKDGLWILLDDVAAVAEVLDALDRKLASSHNFFTGADVTVHAGNRTLADADRARLAEILETRYGLRIKELQEGVPRPAGIPAPREPVNERDDAQAEPQSLSHDVGDDIMKALDETFWIPVRQPQAPREPESDTSFYEGEGRTLYFRGTVRSGQSLEYLGNIVILGDVNAGAYVIAGGDIIVMGRLHGVVHAGAEGEERAVVIAAGFSPSQLRIARYIGRAPDDAPQGKTERHRQTEKASIKDDGIMIEPIV